MKPHLPVSPRSSRVAVLGALTGSAVLLLAGPAFAHVSVTPEEAAQGGYTKLVFKVPNERDDAATAKLEVNLPADHPLASVSTQPVPGWTAKVTKSKLAKPLEVHGEQVTEAVTKVTWTGGKIQPGQFQEFPISVGPLPEDTDKLVFKALQTYEGGEVVRWIEEPKEGEEEPENPAPVVTLTKATGDGHDDAAAGDADEASAKTGDDADADAGKEGKEEKADSGSDSSDGTARALGITGIVVGVVGAGIGFAGLRRRTGGTPSA